MAINGTGTQPQETPPAGLFDTVQGVFDGAQNDSTPNVEDQAAPDFAASEEPYGQAQDDPEPTFDIEADREAGIDVDHPLYRRMQAMQTPADEGDDGLDAMQAEIEQQKMFGSEQTALAPEDMSYAVDWNGFNLPQLDEADPLFEHRDTISRMIREHVGYVLKGVNAQNVQMTQRAQLTQKRNYLTQVVDAIGAEAGPAKKREALSLLATYKDVALRDPRRWAQDAVKLLGITPKGSQRSAQAQAPRVAPQKTFQQVRGQGRRPSAPSSAAQRPQQYTSTQAAVEAALDAELRAQRRAR